MNDLTGIIIQYVFYIRNNTFEKWEKIHSHQTLSHIVYII